MNLFGVILRAAKKEEEKQSQTSKKETEIGIGKPSERCCQ